MSIARVARGFNVVMISETPAAAEIGSKRLRGRSERSRQG